MLSFCRHLWVDDPLVCISGSHLWNTCLQPLEWLIWGDYWLFCCHFKYECKLGLPTKTVFSQPGQCPVWTWPPVSTCWEKQRRVGNNRVFVLDLIIFHHSFLSFSCYPDLEPPSRGPLPPQSHLHQAPRCPPAGSTTSILVLPLTFDSHHDLLPCLLVSLLSPHRSVLNLKHCFDCVTWLLKK